MTEQRSPQDSPAKKGLSVWQIAASTVAAAFGVQSKANKDRDFSTGKPVHFIIAGIVFTALFVIAIIAVVNLVLS
jgi:hypothetical protein